MVNLGDEFPNIDAKTSMGDMKIHDYMGDSWLVFFSHPADFTPVCTTELGRVQQLVPEFTKRNCKLMALSCDSVDSHKAWIQDINVMGVKGQDIPYPIVADEDRSLAVKLGMLDELEKDNKGLPLTCRAVFIVAPDKKVKLSLLYPATTGRNFNEILRVIDSLQLTLHKKVATPADWTDGKDCMVLPSVGKEEASKLFPKHRIEPVPSGKEYLRFTPQPE